MAGISSGLATDMINTATFGLSKRYSPATQPTMIHRVAHKETNVVSVVFMSTSMATPEDCSAALFRGCSQHYILAYRVCFTARNNSTQHTGVLFARIRGLHRLPTECCLWGTASNHEPNFHATIAARRHLFCGPSRRRTLWSCRGSIRSLEHTGCTTP